MDCQACLNRIQQGQMPSPAHGKEQPFATARAGAAWLESCFAGNSQRVLAESELRMSQQGALPAEKVNGVLGCMKSSIARGLRKGIVRCYLAVPGLCPAPWV